MSRQVSRKTKLKQHRGSGTGKDWKPWIRAQEFNSDGTASIFVDWKTGRQIHLLSQGELWVYLLLNWNDEVEDIWEQYPLPLEETTKIAHMLGIRPADNGRSEMTTDLLVTKKDGSLIAVSVKADKASLIENKRKTDLQVVEKLWWESQQVPFVVVYKEDLDMQTVMNIRDVVPYWDKTKVHDRFSFVRHLIAHKRIMVNMAEEIDYRRLMNIIGDDLWKEYSELERGI